MSLQLSTLAFDVAWEAAGLGAKPVALTMDSPGQSFSERATLVRPAWDELHHLGWAQRGELTTPTMDLLRLVDRPQRELYGWVAGREGPTSSVYGAGSGEDGALVRVDEGWVSVQPVRASSLADAVAGCLPAVRRGPGASMTASVDELAGGGVQPSGVLRSSGSGTGPAERMKQVLARPRLGGGQFFAAGRDRAGVRTRNPAKVTVLDTAEGRWVQGERGQGRDRWIVLAPADREQLVRSLAELLE